MSTGMLLDGILGSEAVDSSGESLSVSGADISDVDKGTCILNWEHAKETKGAAATVGKVIYARKIYSTKDCETERQREYWDRIKLPFIYGICRLYDGAGHDEAKRAAAMIRDDTANGELVVCRFSVEGNTLDQKDGKLKETVVRRVAMTLKPCNRTAQSGLLEDPNAPAGYDKELVGAAKALSVLNGAAKAEGDLLYQRLGGSFEVECNPIVDDDLSKALEAGSGDAAPSALAGGAALAASGLPSKRGAMSVLHSYRGPFERASFRAFAKMSMPEVSDDFLDHFTDLAERYHVQRSQLAKRETGAKALAPPALPVAKTPARKGAAGTVAKLLGKKKATKPPPEPKATIRGVPIEPNPQLTKPVFDEDKGVLHTGIGSFPLYKPEPEHFNKILSDPKVEEVHNRAMESWTKVHKLLKERRLPSEVAMHAVLFANLSPNTPVPMQEMMYAHLVDAMHATGADARQPGFSDKVKADWMSRDRPDVPPEHERGFFANHPGVHLQNASKDTGRQPGDLGGFMLPHNKMINMDRYHLLHNSLVDMVNRNGADARTSATELMNHKYKGGLWEAQRARAVAAGKPDPGPYDGPLVAGLAPKTSRYMLGMMGGGNVFVPDTHMVRHLSGMEQRKDAATYDAIKGMMWDEKNSDILSGIDRWYAKNHPAVQHMVNHPRWGKHFDKPEDAIFPAFWKHWIGIAPDERSRGMFNQNYSEGTTHAPFWSAIDPFADRELGKGDPDDSLAARTAAVHEQYVRDYGEVPASMLYYAFLVPHLLDAAEQRQKRGRDLTFLVKAERVGIELSKAVADMDAPDVGAELPTIHRVHLKIGGQHHPAGRLMVSGGHLHHLEDYHGLLGRVIPEGPVTTASASRLHGLQMSPHLSVERDEWPLRPEVHSDASGTAEAAPVPTPAPAPASRASVFRYQRAGMENPHTLEVHQGVYTLDGQRLSLPEVQTIVRNVRSGAAMLRYPDVQAGRVAKAEEALLDLFKAEELDPSSALQHVRAAVAAGHVSPEVERALTRHIYEDPMTAGVGNKYAYGEFRAKQRPGVYVSMDGNDFSEINNAFGHDVGDQAIKGFGHAARSSMDEAAPGVGKLFRPGGDEFMAHFPSFEHAAKFTRSLSQRLGAMPPVGGAHQLSMSFGFGATPEHADKALYHAKDQKIVPGTKDPAMSGRVKGTRKWAVGQVPSLAHSLVPGQEGPVPVHDVGAAGVHHTLGAAA